jgi:hypothetical protein
MPRKNGNRERGGRKQKKRWNIAVFPDQIREFAYQLIDRIHHTQADASLLSLRN